MNKRMTTLGKKQTNRQIENKSKENDFILLFVYISINIHFIVVLYNFPTGDCSYMNPYSSSQLVARKFSLARGTIQ